ncbi:MAG: permease-like cell division protein FtsX [Clostridiales bacterium]|jgi:cell division transport system permease protein|nr:permease-like cell division protein FtsX [Clostridiales bacterium]
MKHLLNNADYFLKEVKAIVRINLLSNILSFISTALIFFILAMVISGWWMSNHVIAVIQGEAEINAYFAESISSAEVIQLADAIKRIDGVREAQLINEGQAYARMVEILGKEARVLEYFDENPFSPFIEIKIHLERMDAVLAELHLLSGIEHVRDNRDVLERLRNLAGIIRFLGYLIVTAVGISTLVIISHIIRQGIDNNREQINTLRLLGAPESFIAFPFLLVGLLLSIGGGILATMLAAYALRYVYAQVAGPLPFIPLPPRETLVLNLIILIASLSTFLGIAGSLFGLFAAKNNQ